MKTYLSVNEVLERKSSLHGKGIEVEGLLEAVGVFGSGSEGYALLHYPKSERLDKPPASGFYSSGLWIEFGSGSLALNHKKLSQWVGKRVRILGIFWESRRKISDENSEGLPLSTPWAMWSQFIEPYSLQRVVAEQRREDRA